MILSCYITNHFISAVLFDVDSFHVVSRDYIVIPYQDGDFFKAISTSKVKDLITEKLKMDSAEYDDLKKIAVLPRDDDKIEGYNKYYTLRQVQEALSNRIFSIDLYESDFAFKNNKKLANKYANYKAYHKPLTEDLFEQLLNHSVYEYVSNAVINANTLKEIIISFEENKDLETDSYIMKKIVKTIADNTKINQMYEVTFDFGYSIIPIVAGLIESKTDPVAFFKENPIHVDYKLVVIPKTEDSIQVLTKDLHEVEPQKDAIGLLYIESTDKDIVKIRSKNPKTKLNLEFNGCRYGVYLDTSNKNADV